MLAHTQLVKALKKMQPKEQKQLLELAQSPLHNKKPEVTRLLQALLERLNSTQHLDEQTVWQITQPDQAFSSKQLGYLLSHGLALVRDYLVWQKLEQEPHIKDRLLLLAQKDRGMDDLLVKEYAARSTGHANDPAHDAHWHLHGYLLQQIGMELPVMDNRAQAPDLRPAQEQLTAFFLAEYLRTSAIVLSQQPFNSGGADKLPQLQALLQVAESSGLNRTSAAVGLHYLLVQVFMHPDEDTHFQAWKAAFKAQSTQLRHTEQRGAFLMALNHCIKRMNGGHRPYIREAFELYRDALGADLLHEKGHITGYTYKNIIRIGTALGEHDWVEQFFTAQATYLHPRERNEVCAYNQAFLHFQRREYHLAMPLLQRTNITDRLNALDARRMLIRSYYELGEWSALESLMASFTIYLKRQKDLGYHRDMYMHFMAFIRKVIQCSLLTETDRSRLADEIRAMNPVADKEWLLGLL